MLPLLYILMFYIQMGSFEGHSLPVRDLCFSSDGDRLITAAEDCRVKVCTFMSMCLHIRDIAGK